MKSVNSHDRAGYRVVLFSVFGFGIISVLSIIIRPSLVQSFYPLPEDQGSHWYYWQIPFMNHGAGIVVWGAYILHQLSVWGLFLAGRRSDARKAGDEQAMTGDEAEAGVPGADSARRAGVLQAESFDDSSADPNGRASAVKGDAPEAYRTRPVFPYGLAMTLVNLLFVALHLLQTRLWYGGLAQFVPIWTSQGSVIVMLVLLMIMEMPRRGLFWGHWHRVPGVLRSFLNRWHGVYISWALVYTFWFHPMDGNWGLMSGFVYMFLLFTQMNLFQSPLHGRRGWVLTLEAFVLIHGTLISLYKNLAAWPMFFFGFLAVIVITYMHSWNPVRWVKLLVAVIYAALVAAVYSVMRGWTHIMEITYIPLALYAGAIGLWLTGRAWEFIILNTKSKS